MYARVYSRVCLYVCAMIASVCVLAQAAEMQCKVHILNTYKNIKYFMAYL